MTGEMEVVRHDLDESRQQASDLKAANAVLQARLTTLEAAPPPQAAPPPPIAPVAEAAPPAPASQLNAAEAAVRNGDFATAEPLLRDYVDHYGEGPRGPEAKFYLGKTLMARHEWADAATADIGADPRLAEDAVGARSGRRSGDKDLVALKKPADGCQALDELARRYPKPSPEVLHDAAGLRVRAKCG